MSLILVVDDESNVLTSFQKMLSKDSHMVRTASSGEEALRLLSSESPDLILMDIRMAGLSGLETFRRAKLLVPRTPVLIMTAHGTSETAIEAMKLGAFDYLLKPFDIPALKTAIASGLAAGRFMRMPVAYGSERSTDSTERIVGQSPAMYDVYKRIGQVASLPVMVLISGESGTGKELIARALYQHSPRADRLFLAVNCAAIPDSLLESELFGAERGAFTGAAMRRLGKFEQANGGTLFLDEIGDMSMATQAKGLRILQEQTFDRLGGHEPVRVDVRIIAATNKPLEQLVRERRFREDLYFRLKVVTIAVPPLRERRDDIPMLAEYFLARHAREFGKDAPRLAPEALERLRQHDWPGNVRELEHCLRQAVALSKGPVLSADALQLSSPASTSPATPDRADLLRGLARQAITAAPGEAFSYLVEQAELQLIAEALEQTRGNLTQAAKLLGITRPTLRDKIGKYHLERSFHLESPGE